MFRTLSKSKIGIILAVLFGASLFFFRSGSRDSSYFNSDSVIASVSGTNISNTKFMRTLELNINNFNKIIGKELTKEEIKAFNIQTLALNSLIASAAFENEYDKINFKLHEKIIAQKTKDRIPQLYNANNKLDEVFLKSFLSQQQLKIEDIVQIIDFETRDDYFVKSFFDINYPSFFSKKINNYDNHERNISYINFKIDKISTSEFMNEDSADSNILEIEKFYNKNISNYMSKEVRNVDFVIIDKRIIKNNFIPTSFEVQEYFNKNKDIFFENEKRSFIQFNFKDKVSAVNFKNKIKNLKTNQILEYAKEKNIRFNEFKNLESSEILEELSKPLFSLKLNQQSEIIVTSLAQHILILQSIKNPVQLKLKEVEDKITSNITNIDSDNYFIDLTNQISNKIIEGENIFDITKNLNLKINNIENLNTDFKGNKEYDQNFIPDLIKKSFSSNKDFVSDVINLNNNVSYFYNVNNIEESSALNLEKIKDRVFEDWKYFKKIDKLKLIIKSNNEKSSFLKDLSKDFNVNLNKITISQNTSEIPTKLINDLFDLDINKATYYIKDDEIIIAKVNKLLIQENSDNLTEISLIQDLKSSFGQELMKDKKINFNEELINAILERY